MGTIARGWAVEQLGDVRGAVVWDLYGGIGDTAVALAERGAQVVSVDADEKAIDWARRREVPRPVRFIAGRAEDVLPTLPEPSAVVVNPPRAGDRKSTRLNSSHTVISYAVFCLKKKKKQA